MKTKLLLTTMLMMATASRAALFTASPNALVPDNDPNGYVSTINVSGLASSLQTATVSFNILGGYNGDFQVFLAYNGQLLTLLNRVGTPGFANGYDNAGFDITVSDAGTAGLHDYRDHSPTYNGNNQLTGTWQPDSGGATFASRFENMDPNGAWSLLVADLNQGDQGTLVSWSLDITAVPEPATTALGIFAGAWGLTMGFRALRRRAARKSAQK
jgi:subtilisin-like proprotein convertase family protein